MQKFVQMRSAAAGENRFETATKFKIALRSLEETSEERAQIETCSASEDWNSIPRGDLFDARPGESREISCGEILCGLGDIDQMMRDPLTLTLGQFRRANPEPAIDLHRIAVDDFTVKFAGQREPKRTFPRGRGTHDSENFDGCAIGGRGAHFGSVAYR